MMLERAINEAGKRLSRRLVALAGVSDHPKRLERRLFSPAWEEAGQRLGAWMEEAGLSAWQDALGNVCGAREGSLPNSLYVGSHFDTVVDAGAYDGALGVLLGIAVAECLRDAGWPLRLGFGALAFSDEEGVRFRSAFLGSAYFAGRFDPAWLDLADEDGRPLRQWLEGRGAALEQTRETTAAIRADDLFIEPHIEQGPVLEAEGKALGVFTGIAAQRRIEVEVTGKAAHAGTTPVALRRDALAGAAAMILAVEEAGAHEDRQTRATVGRISVEPGASNVIPARVRFSIDLREPETALLRATWRTLEKRLRSLARSRRLEVSAQALQETAEAVCDPGVIEALAAACIKRQGAAPRLVSGAGHDCMQLARVCRAGMLATRCRGGLSHHPDEHASAEDCQAALRALVDAALELDRKEAE